MLVRVEMCRLPAEHGDELRELRRDLRLDRRAVVRDTPRTGASNRRLGRPTRTGRSGGRRSARAGRAPLPPPPRRAGQRTIALVLVTIPSSCARATPRLMPLLRPKSSALTISTGLTGRPAPPAEGARHASRGRAPAAASSRATSRATGLRGADGRSRDRTRARLGRAAARARAGTPRPARRRPPRAAPKSAPRGRARRGRCRRAPSRRRRPGRRRSSTFDAYSSPCTSVVGIPASRSTTAS